jgi:hypothetical protein
MSHDRAASGLGPVRAGAVSMAPLTSHRPDLCAIAIP